MSARTNPPDNVGFLLLVGLAAIFVPIGLLALTAFGLAGMLAVYAVCWFFGRPSLLFWWAGSAIAYAAIVQPHSAVLTVWLNLCRRYWTGWSLSGHLSSFLSIWLNPTNDRSEGLILFAAGVVVGTIVFLLAKDKTVRDETTLANANSEILRRAPVALLSFWLISKLPNRMGRFTLIGAEYYHGRPALISDSELNKHGIAAGTTGAGKTEFALAIVESAIRKGHPVLYIDGKGDTAIAARIRAFAERTGRNFYIFNGVDTDASDVYNPLSHGTFTSKSDRIIALRDDWTEPHYELLASGFLQTVFKILYYEKIETDLVKLTKYMSIAALLSLLRRKGHQNPQKLNLANEAAGQEDAEKTAISSLKAEVKNLANSALGSLFDTEQAAKENRTIFNLTEARAQSAVTFFALPGMMYPKTAGKIARLVINDLKAAAVSAKGPYLVVLEELSVYSGPQILHLLSMGRSTGLEIVLLC